MTTPKKLSLQCITCTSHNVRMIDARPYHPSPEWHRWRCGDCGQVWDQSEDWDQSDADADDDK